MSALETYIGTLRLDRPGIVASGIMDETGGSMARMFKLGAGAVVTKSIGSERRDGHRNPSFVEIPCGYVNAMGLPNPGIGEFGEEMGIATKAGIVIGSIFASSAKEFSALAEKMESYGASAVELNLSCPHAKGYGIEMGTDVKMVHSIVSS
ncbi:MAG: dihydroorotate dehydrogenase, partial [Methanomassiliicoccaceae archaeon]|nr:dihydroorotate dehydrogenase [Methanomassiliicoccaceae archaeon]